MPNLHKRAGVNQFNPCASQKEKARILRKIGSPKLSGVPLPKCPAKTKKIIRRLEEAGDFSHSDYYPPEPGQELWSKRKKKGKADYHFPCEICGCKRTAGLGTNHLGWGLCYSHERSVQYRMKRKEIEEGHLLALQQHNPRYYVDADKMITDIVKKGNEAENAFNLEAEVAQVKNILSLFYSSVSDFEKEKKNQEPIIQAVVDLKNAIQDKEIAEQEAHDIARALENIQARLTCPLTENSKFGPVPMSDATRIKLSADTLPKLTRSIKDLHDILKEQWITEEAFAIWCRDLVMEFDKKFGEHTLETDEGSFKIVEMIADCFRRIGQPRRGT